MLEKTDKKLTAAFSGHRDISPSGQYSLFTGNTGLISGDEYIISVKEKTRDAIEQFCNKGYKYFLCGMAEGFDLLAGEAVLELKETYPDIGLIAVIPFPGQPTAFKPENKRIYNRISAEAAAKITVCTSYSRDCFHRRNDYLVSNSNALICFFNGTKGGTEYTVKQAIKQGHKITNVF